MYSDGNLIALDGTSINYSDFLPSTVDIGDGSARYLTAKLDGLFVLAAQLQGISQLSISGRTGSSSSSRGGSIETDEFTLEVGGTPWRAFVKRTLFAGTPSVQHLFLVPDAPGLSRTFSPFPELDVHAISGLPSKTEFHFLVYSRDQGGDYSQVVPRTLARTYLENLLPGPDWILPVPPAGIAAAGGDSAAEFLIDTTTLPAGSHSTRFAVTPVGVEPETWQTLTVHVAQPTFALSAETLNVAGLVGFSPDPIELQTTSRTGSTPYPELEVVSSQPWLQATPTTAGKWRIAADTVDLPPAVYVADLTFNDGQSVRIVPVTLTVEARRYSILRADPARPRLYALSQVASSIDELRGGCRPSTIPIGSTHEIETRYSLSVLVGTPNGRASGRG